MIARIHPATLESRNWGDADSFVVEGESYRVVRSESVPVGEVELSDDDGDHERVLELDEVRN